MPDPIIDIHQHTNYSGRTDPQLLAHQRRMGIAQTILLPAGAEVIRPSTHNGKSNGLAAQITGNDAACVFAANHPIEYHFFANEVPDLPNARAEIEKCLKRGGLGIGEQKFAVDCDSNWMQGIFDIAQDYQVPVLMHIQHEMYNTNFLRFESMLKKYPRVNFIGHAQTFWANIDANHADQSILYPKTPVKPGGFTDRLLSDYPNMFADLSAGSGLNSLQRDQDHAKDFLSRHQNKLMYGSDCNDTAGVGAVCSGASAIVMIRRLSPSKDIERKILHDNAKKMFGI
ncbi:MAG TPA: amidohydrolase family protein [Tepidisphaeraceae bacterium]|jgi:predicted TIM-barrel fold metal-dependent hydrolase|nr:amidohydrolase family protein [Tepidisphaeraceae bacterium]